MEFQHIGKHCAVSSCHQHDFLPFTCHCCNKTFCLEHRDFTSHACSNNLKGDARTIICPICSKSLHYDSGITTVEELWNKHAATDCRQGNYQQAQLNKKPVKLCGSSGCGEKLTMTNTCVCKICRKELCLKHRFDYQHDCLQLEAPKVLVNKNQPSQDQRQAPNQKQKGNKGQGQKKVGEVQKKIQNFFGGIGSVFKSPIKSQNTNTIQNQNPIQSAPVGNNATQNNTTNSHLTEVCQICDKGYATHYELLTHFQSTHIE